MSSLTRTGVLGDERENGNGLGVDNDDRWFECNKVVKSEIKLFLYAGPPGDKRSFDDNLGIFIYIVEILYYKLQIKSKVTEK